MAYCFYMDGVLLPVTPSSLSVKIKDNNKTVTLINGEEINLLKSPKLTEINFEALLPNIKYPFAVYPNDFFGTAYYLEYLEKLKLEKRPFSFVVTRELPSGIPLDNSTYLVSLEEYEIKEDAENGFDSIVSVHLKQYRPYETGLVNVSVTAADGSKAVLSAKEQERPVTKEIPKTYTAVEGDCLWNICRKVLGDGTKCWEVAKQNGIPDPNKIYPGQVIQFA